MDVGATRVDLRLVPAALTSWAVTAAGILWQMSGLVAAMTVAIVATAATGWWSRGRGEPGADHRPIGTGILAVAVVGLAFGIAVGLRVEGLRHHPINQRYGTVATVVVTPSDSPRSLGGNRTMFRGSLRALDGTR